MGCVKKCCSCCMKDQWCWWQGRVKRSYSSGRTDFHKQSWFHGTALLENSHGRDICYRCNTLAVAKLGIPQCFFRSVHSLSHVQFFVTPWTAALQASLSIANSGSLLKLMSIMSVMPSNYLILCCPLLLLPSIFPSTRVFSNESVLCIRWPSIGVSASPSILPMNIQDWFPLGWTGWISL